MSALSPASSSLRAFLASAKSSLQKAIASKEPVNFVIGNESADLDSISSSILFAYLRSQEPSVSGFPSLHIPLVNIPRSDIKIRRELLAVLPYANLEPDHLITLDDLPSTDVISSQLNPEKTRWCLVDHNAFLGPLKNIYSSRVSGCIDHHKEEDQVPHNVSDQPRIVETAGSCTSLVINHFRDAWDKLSEGASQSNVAQPQSDSAVGTDDAAVRRVWDSQIAKFALGSILVDTHNLEAVDKVTSHDTTAVEFLEAKVHMAPSPNAQLDRKAFFKELNKAKKDVKGMSLNDILRKDYKQWDEENVNLGISSVKQSLSDLLPRSSHAQSFRQELQEFAEARNLAVFVIMTSFSTKAEGYQRELLILAADSSAGKFPDKFVDYANKDLGLEPHSDSSLISSEPGMQVFQQRETEMSRKQVAPLLREALKL